MRPIFLIAIGLLIWVITLALALLMHFDLDFYLWVINQPQLSNMGGTNNQAITYMIGFLIGFIILITSIRTSRSSQSSHR
jgi:uncharacterized membrane protein